MEKQAVKITWLLFLLLITVDIYIFSLTKGLWFVFLLFTQVLASTYGFIKIRKSDYRIVFLVEAEISNNNPIIREVWDEVIQVSACICLLVPGIISDLTGVLLLQPVVRIWMLDTAFYNAH